MLSPAEIEHYQQVASKVMAMCKRTQPSFWSPDNNPDMARSWGYIMATKPFPEPAYLESVAEFYANETEGRRPEIGDIIAATKRVIARWETDPQRREQLKQARKARMLEVEKRIVSSENTSPKQVSAGESRQIPENRALNVLEEVRRRQQAKQAQNTA